MPAVPCAGAASLVQDINLEPNPTGLCNFPLAASLNFLTQNISRIHWLHLLHPLIDVVSDSVPQFRRCDFVRFCLL